MRSFLFNYSIKSSIGGFILTKLFKCIKYPHLLQLNYFYKVFICFDSLHLYYDMYIIVFKYFNVKIFTKID